MITDDELNKLATNCADNNWDNICSYNGIKFGYKNGYKDAEKQYKYNDVSILPKQFGTYLVVLNSPSYLGHVAFKTYIPPQSTDNIEEELFGIKKQTGWILDDNEKLIYWMEIPNWY